MMKVTQEGLPFVLSCTVCHTLAEPPLLRVCRSQVLCHPPLPLTPPFHACFAPCRWWTWPSITTRATPTCSGRCLPFLAPLPLWPLSPASLPHLALPPGRRAPADHPPEAGHRAQRLARLGRCVLRHTSCRGAGGAMDDRAVLPTAHHTPLTLSYPPHVPRPHRRPPSPPSPPACVRPAEEEIARQMRLAGLGRIVAPPPPAPAGPKKRRSRIKSLRQAASSAKVRSIDASGGGLHDVMYQH